MAAKESGGGEGKGGKVVEEKEVKAAKEKKEKEKEAKVPRGGEWGGEEGGGARAGGGHAAGAAAPRDPGRPGGHRRHAADRQQAPRARAEEGIIHPTLSTLLISSIHFVAELFISLSRGRNLFRSFVNGRKMGDMLHTLKIKI